jgi:dTDP-4-amino-4,6-dideoxygalactose transaminase
VSVATSVSFLDLRFQFQSIQAELENAALRVLRSGHYILGPELANFENQFAGYVNYPYAVGVSSGTDAIELALRAQGIGPGDDVLTVANVSAPTICAILASGARPVLIDIDPDTYNIDPESIREYLQTSEQRHRARAIVPVHLYGRLAEMQSIREIARENEMKVIVDAAQAHGASFGGDFSAAIGDLGCFSLYPTKNLGAAGDAGIVVTNDKVIANRLKMLRNYGEIDRYDNREIGINSRLDEIQAAMLSVKLQFLNQWIDRRRRIADQYNQAFLAMGLLREMQLDFDPQSHVYHLYVIRVENRDAFRAAMAENGVQTGVHYPRPIHHQPAFQDRCHQGISLKHTEESCRQVVSLPLYPEMSDDQVQMVIEATATVLRRERCTLQNMG